MHPVMSEINPSKISEAKNIKLFFVCLFFVSLDPVPPGEESDLITSVKFMLHRFTSASFPGFHWSHSQAFIGLIPRFLEDSLGFTNAWLYAASSHGRKEEPADEVRLMRSHVVVYGCTYMVSV